MLKLVIANKNYSSWSLRPWILMQELNIPFIEQIIPFNAELKSFDSFSPNGKVPCLIDGSTVIWDSLAIIEYLAEQMPKVWATDFLARAWSRCAAAEMHSEFRALRHYCTMNCGLRIQLDSYQQELEQDIARLDELWCEGLTSLGGAYLAGQSFTAVDAFFAPVAFRVQTYNLAMSSEALAYAKRLLALPPMQEWYSAALRETWRDEAHEEMARNGTWLHDYRAVAD